MSGQNQPIKMANATPSFLSTRSAAQFSLSPKLANSSSPHSIAKHRRDSGSFGSLMYVSATAHQFVQRAPNLTHKRRAITEHFSCKTLTLLIKLGKLIQMYVLISVRWGPYKFERCATNIKIRQNRSSKVLKYLQKRYDTHRNTWEHDTDTCWGLPFLCNCKELSSGIQAWQGWLRKLLSVTSSKILNHWWPSWFHSLYGSALVLFWTISEILGRCKMGTKNADSRAEAKNGWHFPILLTCWSWEFSN